MELAGLVFDGIMAPMLSIKACSFLPQREL